MLTTQRTYAGTSPYWLATRSISDWTVFHTTAFSVPRERNPIFPLKVINFPLHRYCEHLVTYDEVSVPLFMYIYNASLGGRKYYKRTRRGIVAVVEKHCIEITFTSDIKTALPSSLRRIRLNVMLIVQQIRQEYLNDTNTCMVVTSSGVLTISSVI